MPAKRVPDNDKLDLDKGETSIQGDIVFPGPPVKNKDKPAKPIPLPPGLVPDDDKKAPRNRPLKGK